MLARDVPKELPFHLLALRCSLSYPPRHLKRMAMSSASNDISDEETSLLNGLRRRRLSYCTTCAASDSEDVEYTSSNTSTTCTAVNVGNFQRIITRAPARRARGPFTSALEQFQPGRPQPRSSAQRVENSEPSESIAAPASQHTQVSCNCRPVGWGQLIFAGLISGMVVISSLALVFTVALTRRVYVSGLKSLF
ncbi:uncharacterized protein EV420DRAFT_118667 [Desarmillaria tabescens]|uniref:Uncharacterized protein n=1 Tax=Armillaria tabescens TaxID=1929756 RepID=A0AA39N9P3_ARMTA|nr:uncharacterized protein EV420DRAFT_118667 [Desarmillaria tabescens]KAK0461612.1 hypothetical protein EV420DRAFT_118667 [Desarmillaria tabescens]